MLFPVSDNIGYMLGAGLDNCAQIQCDLGSFHIRSCGADTAVHLSKELNSNARLKRLV